ncbi:NAD(P)H-binding protein [Pseudomonas sp. NA-150]|uniref:NAD(P)H-binding protein n=1 Tax=Pseudomonas sp. NA-150 TaxID=3367525 RepID=UPI0037C5219F
MSKKPIALVLGATGGIGGEVARQLFVQGWSVRALHRNPASVRYRDVRFDWRCGDAMRGEDLLAAAEGAALIVHAVNPPGYRNWEGLVLPMIDNSIAAARASGARVLLPGTVYNYGPDAFPACAETSPQNPLTRKGGIRVKLEQRLQAAALTGVRSLVVRAGDFFGTRHSNSWFASGLLKPGQPVKTVRYPGTPGVGHQWAYLPDVARTMIRLLEHEQRLAPFATFHMRGHWDPDGTRMVDTILRQSGQANVTLRGFPWWTLPVIAPFSETFRELKEMRYLWQQPLCMDNARLLEVLGAEPHTPWDEAVRATLEAMECV